MASRGKNKCVTAKKRRSSAIAKKKADDKAFLEFARALAAHEASPAGQLRRAKIEARRELKNLRAREKRMGDCGLSTTLEKRSWRQALKDCGVSLSG